tara:strand:+ start:612 stop:887 length:276 start_codon:yes stop_codon:yes gene_type:complete
MGTLVVMNLPDDLHKRLRQLAERNDRSVTKQAIQLIESGLSKPVSHLLTLMVKDERAMSREELEAALHDGRYRHYASLDELNAHMDELRSD